MTGTHQSQEPTMVRRRHLTITAACLLALAPLAACTTGPTIQTQDDAAAGSSSSTSTTTGTSSSTAHEDDHSHDETTDGDEVDLTALPLGDGDVSTSPEVGSVYSCQTSFNGGGAFVDGPWIDEETGTFDFTAKAVVDGDVSWPSELSITVDGDRRLVTGNALPDHTTGEYPVSRADDAYQYDRNPNSIQEQTLVFDLPANPTVADEPTCTGLGPVGVMVTGSYVFNALDAEGRDAVAHELQDACQGHPERSGAYHYHNLSSCIDDGGEGHSELVGYARDGFGIYGVRGEDGETLTNEDLDACHGHTHEITWDGEVVELYHYHATYEYPYTIGCYVGTPS